MGSKRPWPGRREVEHESKQDHSSSAPLDVGRKGDVHIVECLKQAL
jgi:hypothetical protein